MCTATYFPYGPNGFALTHSRDEKAIRPAARAPKTVGINGWEVTFPQDPQGQGTWIASGERFGRPEKAVCLLNGAFIPHQPKPPYRHSRGLVPLHFFGYPSCDAFVTTYDFTHIEPFTLLVVEPNRLVELRWNGNRLFMDEKDPERAYIWSSVTLYTPETIRKREDWFWAWRCQHFFPTVEDIRRFHQTAGDDDPENSLRMNRRNTLLTVSLTSVVHDNETATMIYEDFTQSAVYQPIINSAYATV